MPRYKLTIEYDGGSYIGWQKQPGFRSIQSSLEEAVFKFCGQEIEVAGAGRTDAGVHAIAQTAHIDLPKPFDTYRVMQGINYYLFNPDGADSEPQENPNCIAVTQAEEVPETFHARFSATKRHYIYRIINRRARLGLEAGRAWHVVEDIDIAAMQAGAKELLGHHDFTSFRDSECQAKSPMKTLEQLDIARDGDYITINTSARSFLHHQVRIMVGTLAMVGKGKWQPQDIKTALLAKDRASAGPTAPPDGLYLAAVDY